ncbi:MAG: L-serine ammonia-lyase, partial [Terriglobales bacterium]
METSIFEIFKIGIGPSSSHTVGPMRAAREFVSELDRAGKLTQVHRIAVDLYGSLALTGKGHGTDRAIILGLLGEKPDEVDTNSVEAKLNKVRTSKQLNLLGKDVVKFEEENDLRFLMKETLPGHSNTMRLTAFDRVAKVVDTQIYYSIGGGFIQRDGQHATQQDKPPVPYPFRSADELLRIGEETGLPICQIVLENEKAWRPESEIRAYIEKVWHTMQACLNRGLQTEGILPGGLKVRRRASALARKLAARNSHDPLTPLDWVNAFAMAVNEENAAGGRVVTAPTNGAAGIIPAVGEYYARFIDTASRDGIMKYLLTASAIGILYKENASISGAEVGC